MDDFQDPQVGISVLMLFVFLISLALILCRSRVNNLYRFSRHSSLRWPFPFFRIWIGDCAYNEPFVFHSVRLFFLIFRSGCWLFIDDSFHMLYDNLFHVSMFNLHTYLTNFILNYLDMYTIFYTFLLLSSQPSAAILWRADINKTLLFFKDGKNTYRSRLRIPFFSSLSPFERPYYTSKPRLNLNPSRAVQRLGDDSVLGPAFRHRLTGLRAWAGTSLILWPPQEQGDGENPRSTASLIDDQGSWLRYEWICEQALIMQVSFSGWSRLMGKSQRDTPTADILSTRSPLL